MTTANATSALMMTTLSTQPFARSCALLKRDDLGPVGVARAGLDPDTGRARADDADARSQSRASRRVGCSWQCSSHIPLTPASVPRAAPKARQASHKAIESMGRVRRLGGRLT